MVSSRGQESDQRQHHQFPADSGHGSDGLIRPTSTQLIFHVSQTTTKRERGAEQITRKAQKASPTIGRRDRKESLDTI